MTQKKTSRHSWKTIFSKKMTSIEYLDRFTQDEQEQLAVGHIPDEMEYKWFTFYEDDVLHFHRSLTGYCIYKVRLQQVDDYWVVVEAKVNADKKHYDRGSDRYEVEFLRWLIRGSLLDQDAEFPVREEFDREG